VVIKIQQIRDKQIQHIITHQSVRHMEARAPWSPLVLYVLQRFLVQSLQSHLSYLFYLLHL